MNEEGPSILWTVMPLELVVKGLPGGDRPSARAVEVDGRLMEVLPDADGTGVIQRLLSTNPWDFLDVRWQPGSRISLQPDRYT